MPISILISNLIAFSIQFALFLGFMLYFWLSGAAIQPNLWILFTPVLLLMMAGLGLGFGIIVSSLTTRYRDPALPGHVRRSALDVCHPGHLPGLEHPERFRHCDPG